MTVKYAKLINNSLEFAPANYENIINFNKDPELMLTHGYKEVVETELPTTKRRFRLAFNETETKIIEVIQWLETEEEFEQREERERQEHIKNLTCTKRVFALMLRELGVSYTSLKQLIATSEDAALEWDLCVELLRSNPMLDQMAAHLSISSEQLDMMFLCANGELNIEELRKTKKEEPVEEPETEEPVEGEDEPETEEPVEGEDEPETEEEVEQPEEEQP